MQKRQDKEEEMSVEFLQSRVSYLEFLLNSFRGDSKKFEQEIEELKADKDELLKYKKLYFDLKKKESSDKIVDELVQVNLDNLKEANKELREVKEEFISVKKTNGTLWFAIYILIIIITIMIFPFPLDDY